MALPVNTVLPAAPTTVTISIATPCVITWAAHGQFPGNAIILQTTGALPTGLTANTLYYVIAAGFQVGQFEIAATVGGAAINTSGTQSGVQTAVAVISTLPNAPQATAGGVAIGFPTDQGAQPYTGTWTARNGNITNAGAQSAVVAVMGGALSHNYVPADTITLTDGAPSVHGVLTVTTTGVSAASINAAGTFTGTTGTFTVTGTTGTGTKFTASCTLTNGSGITAVLSILTAGIYTANPTTLTAEPVTAANLSTASLNIKMGVVAASVTTAGNVTAVPANPVAQASSSGVGTGATFTMTYIGISQTLMASNASRKSFFIQNPMTALGQNIAAAENLYINYTSASGVQDGVSIELGPGGAVPIGPVISTELISVNAQTLGHRYIAREM